MSNDDLSDRLSFMQVDDRTRTSLRNVRSVVAAELPAALATFYGQVRRFPETRRHFTDDAHIAKASNAQLRHWDGITSGEFSDSYKQAVTTIGGIHARIGLEPRWYIGGYAMVLEQLVRAVVRRQPGFAIGGKQQREDLGETLGALIKATLLDMDLVLDVYFKAAETERLAAEAQRAQVAAEQTAVVSRLAAALAALARGDLTVRTGEAFPGEYEKLGQDFNGATSQLETAVSAVIDAVTTMTASVDELRAATEDLSRRTEHQAATLEETAAAVEEITVTVQKTADGARRTADAVKDARHDAEENGGVMSEAIEAMSAIEESSRKISQIIGVIDEIAFQTNLLALNAGVEAARAGDAGRGFAVVASEVRALAQRAAGAAKEIKVLIQESSQQVGSGVELVGRTGDALGRIVTRVAEVDELVRDIAGSAKEQALGLGQINSAVADMDRATQQNAAMVEESAAAAISLADSAQQLRDLVGRFHVGGAAIDARRPTASGARRAAA